MALDLDISMDQKSVSGTARLEFERRAPSGKALVLDAAGFVLRELRLSTKDSAGKTEEHVLSPDAYSYDSDQIRVPLLERVVSGSLLVAYEATPRLGLYFLEPDAAVPDRPRQVWSQCQDEDGKHWFPCQDKPHVKMTYEIRARIPEGMTMLSGGRLVDKQTPLGKKHEYHYRLEEPTPAYLVTLVVGEFEEWTEKVKLPSGREVELRFLVPPGRVADGRRGFERTAEAMRLFSEKTGVEYPFDTYSQVVVADFIFGGMENTTATTMYEHILIDKTAALDIESHDLVAHELAHHWFGDLVTCRDWSHGWLNEGFATYFEHVERQHREGLDEYEHHVTVDLNIYLGEADGDYSRAIVCRDYEEPIDLFDRHLYQKGGLVLHMLRKELGEDCFWRGVKSYLIENQGGIVETNDLMRTLENASGLSLERFFDQWVYRPGHPSLKVNVSFEDGLLTVDVEQTQKASEVAVFHLPFEIQVCVDGVVAVHRRDIHEHHGSLVVRSEKRPEWVAIDPEYRICAPIHFTAPADLLRALLKKGLKARARRMAAHALGRRQDPKTVKALSECLSSEDELWMVRAKAADSLSKILGQEAEAALTQAAELEEPRVRRAVAEALGSVRSKQAVEILLQLLQDKSYMVTAAAARSLGKIKDDRRIVALKAVLRKSSWSEVVRSGALWGLAQTGDDEVVPTLMEWTRYGRPLRARRTAIAVLPKVGEGRKVRQHLEDMLSDRDPHVRSAVLSALLTLGDSKAKPAILELHDRELNGGVKTQAREVLVALGKDGKAGLREARDESQKLRRELTELRTRVSKLEQSAKQARKDGDARKGKSAVTKGVKRPASPQKAELAAPTAAPPRPKETKSAKSAESAKSAKKQSPAERSSKRGTKALAKKAVQSASKGAAGSGSRSPRTPRGTKRK